MQNPRMQQRLAPSSIPNIQASNNNHPNATSAMTTATISPVRINTSAAAALVSAGYASAKSPHRPPLWSPSVGSLLAFNHHSLSFVMQLSPISPEESHSVMSPRHTPAFSFPLPSAEVRRKPKLQRVKQHFDKYREDEDDDEELDDELDQRSDTLHQRHQQVALRRKALLLARKTKLQRCLEHVRQRVILQRHRERLILLRRKAKTEFALRAANLKRQILLQQNVERYAADVDRAQSLALVHRLKQCVDLKRSYSTTFAEMLRDTTDEERSQLFGDVWNDLKMEDEHELQQLQNLHLLQLDEAGTALESPLEEGISAEEEDALAAAAADQPSTLKRAQSVSFPIQAEERQLLTPQLHSLSAVFGAHLPPITKETLRELNLEAILGATQLRHDLVFDPNLEFRVNDQGERGLAKRKKAEIFWGDIENDLNGSRYGKAEFSRLPVLLNEIREIILELVANDDYRKSVEDHMDVPLMAQQLEHGVLNVVGLIEFIAGTLKAHCAPARDGMVDDMVRECQQGNFAKTLRTCFEILERMKLVSLGVDWMKCA